jgi:hypothetical protein
MRAYLIDPSDRSINEVDLDDVAIEDLLGTKEHPALGAVGLVENEPVSSSDYLNDYLYVPPEFSFEQYGNAPGTIPDARKIKGDPRDWFQILESVVDPNQPASFPYPCRGVIVGLTIDGDWCSSALRPSEVHRRVKFMRGRLTGYAASSAIEQGSIWTGPVIEVTGEPDNVTKLKKKIAR